MKKYNIIYADPPWQYRRNHGQGVAEKHYPTMSIDEICNLPIKNLKADRAGFGGLEVGRGVTRNFVCLGQKENPSGFLNLSTNLL